MIGFPVIDKTFETQLIPEALAADPCRGVKGVCTSGTRAPRITIRVRLRRNPVRSPGSSGKGGGGGGSTTSTLPPKALCFIEQRSESELDTIAQQVAADIAAMIATDSSIEYGTFILEHGGELIALPIASGTRNSLPLGGLYADMNALGILDTQIRGFIHSHPPSTNSNSRAAAGENLINGFPSDNDYNAYQQFATNAVNFGANGSAWTDAFSAYVIGPGGTLREYEYLSQPVSQDFSVGSGNPIPAPSDPGYNGVQNELDQAQEDANNSCGGK